MNKAWGVPRRVGRGRIVGLGARSREAWIEVSIEK